jgi:hypothetical protein
MTSGNSRPARAIGLGSAGRRPVALRVYTARRDRRRPLTYRGRVVRALRGSMLWEICGYSAEPASTQAVHRENSTMYGCSLPPPDYGRGSKDRAVPIRWVATARRARPPPATPPGHEAAALGGPIAMVTSGYSAAAAPPLPPLRRVLSTTCGNIFLEVNGT